MFIAELVAITVRLDTRALAGSHGLRNLIGQWGPASLRFIVVFAPLLVLIGYLKHKERLRGMSAWFTRIPVQPFCLAGHFAILLVFWVLSAQLYGGKSNSADLVSAGWLAAGVAAIAMAVFAFAPPALCLEALRATGNSWMYAGAAALAACMAGVAGRSLWAPATGATFFLVRAALWPFVDAIRCDPAKSLIGSQTFSVEIAPQCSGLEGVGLMVIFGALWLLLFRKEFRFPRALLLIPAGMAAVFTLNAVRIAALILIGNAGAPEIAVGGFHSQAGWIAFNAVALGFAISAERWPWVTARTHRRVESGANPTAAYLAPFLAILAAAMISRAGAGSFEWLYPLRLAAGAAVLWFYRKRYAGLGWSCGWFSIGLGFLVFAGWILDPAGANRGDGGLAAQLGSLDSPLRIAWLSARTLAAVVTVPIAEELAFRGFLIRRLISADFESIDLRRMRLAPFLISSVAFGLLHGDRWLAGTAAGMVYAFALRRRGRIGDAIAAHATTNALLAAWVLIQGDWGRW